MKWLTHRDSHGPRSISWWKGQNLVAFQFMKLDVPADPVWWWSPGGHRESWWSSVHIYVEIQKKSVLEPSNVVVKEYLNNRVNKFPWESGGKEEESQSFFPLCLYVWAAARRCDSEVKWVFPLQMIHSRNPSTGSTQLLGFSWLQV